MGLSRIERGRFLVLGRAGMDLYADPPGTRVENATHFSAALGGSAANTAVAIVRLGGSASLVTTVSDDAVGRYTSNEIRRYGVDAGYVATVGGEARTSLAVVETRNEDTQSVIYRNNASDLQLTEADLRDIPYAKFGALILSGTALATEPSRSAAFLAIELARAAGVAVILDVDYRAYSWTSAAEAAAVCARAANLSDIVVGNDLEFAVMAGDDDGLSLARGLAGRSASIVVYKMGEKGSLTFEGDTTLEVGIYRVTALKPTGAGDAFMGGFVTGLASGLDIATCLRRGSAAAAIVVTRVGCAPAMPTASELQDFISTHRQQRA